MIDDSHEGWGWFDVSPFPHEEIPSLSTLARAFRKCFGTPEGAEILDYLERLTLRRSLGPDASDAMLRHLEGQRHLYAHIRAVMALNEGAPLP